MVIKLNKKALSPVVASIILIAVTVAVSIAVAAWVGALTVGFMKHQSTKIPFELEIPQIENATHASYYLEDMTNHSLSINHQTVEALPYTITGEAENNTHYWLHITYWKATDDFIDIEGKNIAVAPVAVEVMFDGYSYSIHFNVKKSSE